VGEKGDEKALFAGANGAEKRRKMVDFAQALLLGVVQGFTEWLPISSSGHLALIQYFFGMTADVAFDVVLHLGTLAAVIAYYRKDLGRIIYWSLRLRESELREVAFIVLAAVPTAIIAFTFKGFFELMFFEPLYVCIAFLATGIFLIISERSAEESKVTKVEKSSIASLSFATRNIEQKIKEMEKREVGAKEAFIIGVAQGAAVAPGISRSGATIGTGLLLGIEKEEVAKFSFLAAIIPILGAGILEGRNAFAAGIDAGPALLGFAAAAAVGYISIGILLNVLKRGRLRWFGYYCIALCFVVLVVMLMPK
jgi:undecaprenyl-diphosphatase